MPREDLLRNTRSGGSLKAERTTSRSTEVNWLAGLGFVLASIGRVRVAFVLGTPVVLSSVLALFLGIVIEGVRVDGTLGLVLAILACAIAAGIVAVWVRGVAGVFAGTLAGLSVIGLTLALKTIRWPDAPLAGDGLGWLLVLHAVPSALAALLAANAAHLRAKRVAHATDL
jgi:hypothetical protein